MTVEVRLTRANGPYQHKVEAIKAVRELTQLGLKEAKDLVERLSDIPGHVETIEFDENAPGAKNCCRILMGEGIQITYAVSDALDRVKTLAKDLMDVDSVVAEAVLNLYNKLKSPTTKYNQT